MALRNVITALTLLVTLFIQPIAISKTKTEKCGSENFQECRSCNALVQASSKAPPNEGEYIHGAFWNALYAAYIHNCLSYAEELLKRGADPNSGGCLGSMILTVVNRWPHNNKHINERWVFLLIKYGAEARKKVSPENATPATLMAMFSATPDYPDLWKKFLR